MNNVTNLPKWVETLLSLFKLSWTGCLKISNLVRSDMKNSKEIKKIKSRIFKKLMV